MLSLSTVGRAKFQALKAYGQRLITDTRLGREAKVFLLVYRLMRSMHYDQISSLASLLNTPNLMYFLIRYKDSPIYLMTGEMLAKVSHTFGGHFHSLRIIGDSLSTRVSEAEDLNTVRANLEALIKMLEATTTAANETYASIRIAHKAMGEFRLSSNVNMNKIIEELGSRGSTLDEHSNVEIKFDLAGDLASCDLDKDKIKHVIINMLLNAFQATQGQEQRIVRITTRNITFRFEAGIEIQIKDTGCGLPKGKEDRIFEPFFTTKEKHGTGLGLPISKDMIERHGGTLEIANNTDGPGATVTIRLPVKAKVLI